MAKSKGGRPLTEIDQEKFERLCQIFCTKTEICQIFRCDEKTVTAWCKRTYGKGFSDIYKELSADGKMSLRREQFKRAMGGSDTMLIWMGKNYLDQSDKSRNEITGRNGGAIEIESPRERIERKLLQLARREGTDGDAG